MKDSKTRILIADDHALMRVGIRSMLEANRTFKVVGECCDGESAVSAAAELSPDVIIMDIMMPKMNGAEATARILADHPEMRIIILTSFGTSIESANAVKAGAMGALLKEAPSDELIQAIDTVMSGGTVINEEIARCLKTIGDSSEFTPRQLEILRELANGSPDKKIADHFNITIAGVRKHLNAIMSKLGTTNRAETVTVALRRHLLKL